MLANDIAADCVQAGAAHETMLAVAESGRGVPVFTNTTVLSDYRAVNPDDTRYEDGTDVQQYAAYRQKIGIVDGAGIRHKIDVYAALRAGDLAQLALATFLFGAVGVGVSLPDDAEQQFDNGEVWTVMDTPGGGGHYIPCIGRNSHGNFLFVTWGRLQAATPAWVQTYMDEGVAFISRERLNAQGLSPQGYDAAKLNDDFAQVTA